MKKRVSSILAHARLLLLCVFLLPATGLAVPVIQWSNKKLTLPIDKGDGVVITLIFKSSQELRNVRAWPTPALAGYVIINPATFDVVAPGTMYEIELAFRVPPDAQPGTIEGAVHLRTGPRTYASPLPVEITIIEPPGDCVVLVNPSFEEPVVSWPYGRFNSIPGWDGPIDIHPDLPTSDGSQVVDLNQDDFGYLRQIITTTPGTLYTVSWAQGVNLHCAQFAELSVDIDGSSIGIFDSTVTPVYKSATFVATGTSTELMFRSLTGGCGGATIDDVSITCQ